MPGQIEILAQRSIPRVRLPARATVFARRAQRLRQLGASASMGDFLRFLAVLSQASSSKRSAGAARNGSFDYLGWRRISALLPAAGARFGRRTLRTFPLLPPPQKN